jgi:lipopolysaccharide biosynthesis glycosyltransferase
MDGIMQEFRSNPQLELMASGNDEYFNNGVMLARPSARTFSYMTDMLRNGTCKENCSNYNMFRNGTCEVNCTDYNTVMWRKVSTDQDIFIEYTQRFPARFRLIDGFSIPAFNLRPMHISKDEWQNCSIVHFAGAPKPWEAWLPDVKTTVDGSADEFPLLPNGDLPKTIHEMKIRCRESGLHWDLKDWALIAWRDRWNRAVARSRISVLEV